MRLTRVFLSNYLPPPKKTKCIFVYNYPNGLCLIWKICLGFAAF